MSTPAEQKVIDAASLVEALRPSAQNAIGGSDPADDPIRSAWDLARERLRAACAAWLEAMR